MTAHRTVSAVEPEPGSTDFSGRSTLYWRDPWLWATLLLAFALRLGYNLALRGGQIEWDALIIDEREYFGAAHLLAEGRGFSFFDTALWVRPPLYVALLGFLLRLGGDAYLPVLVVQSLLSALSLAPLGLLAYRYGGRGAARLCLSLGALYLPFTLFTGLLLSETLFVFLFAVALLALDTAVPRANTLHTKSAWLWLGLAGFLLGLASLTRATALGFVPLAAGWLYFIARQGGTGRLRSLAVGAALVAVALLTISPWVARNYAAYGRFVPVDTTSGYNLWLGSVGVHDEERLQAELRAITNPADRQAYALERGIENITRDPMFFVSKGLKESVDLWRPLFSAEERQVAGYTSGRIPPWHLLSLILFDDLLYVLILGGAAVGIVAGAGGHFRSLTLLWVVMWVIIAFVFFAVTRFRLPVVAALLPWAGIGLARSVRPRDVWAGLGRGSRVALATALCLILVIVLPSLAIGDTMLGVGRWQAQAPYREGGRLLLEGRVQDAIARYELANRDVPDTRYALAAAYLQVGDASSAVGQLRTDEPPRRFEPYLIRGEAARQSGDLAAARSFFNERVVNLAGDEALRWAWDHFKPEPVRSIELGSGLDIGYVRGFHSVESDEERTFRWTMPTAEVRGLQQGASLARVEWSGWRPAALPSARVMSASPGAPPGGRLSIELPSEGSWRSDMLPLWQESSSTSAVGGVGLGLSIKPFVGSGADPRLLGVRLSRVSVEP